MSFYRNTRSHVEEYELHKAYKIGSLLNYNGVLLEVEDAHDFVNIPICGGCFFNELHRKTKTPCHFDRMGCSSTYRNDCKNIIYKKVV